MFSTKVLVTGLVAVNAVLGAALCVKSGAAVFEREARAQLGAGPQVQVVGGQIANNGTLFVLNQQSGELLVIQTDSVRNTHVVLDRVNVIKDMNAIK
jgi:hypothetical protein